MSGLNPDFLDRFANLVQRVKALERRPSAYMESVIVGGSFNAGTEVPPFFTPFGGAIVSVMARTVSGNADVEIEVNAVVIATLVIDDDGSVTTEEIDPPVYLSEGDQVRVDITGSDGLTSGLSVGVIIHS